MTTLASFYLTYNRRVYGKMLRVPKKAEDRFHTVEMMLTKADVCLEDYTLTTFADRTWIGSQRGYLPWQVFVSLNSVNRYVKRLEQGAEVSRRKEPVRDSLAMELVVGEVTIGITLQGMTATDDLVEHVAQVTPGWLADHRRPIAEAERILSDKYQTSVGSYLDIAQHIKIRRTRARLAEMESRLSTKGYSSAARGSMVV